MRVLVSALAYVLVSVVVVVVVVWVVVWVVVFVVVEMVVWLVATLGPECTPRGVHSRWGSSYQLARPRGSKRPEACAP